MKMLILNKPITCAFILALLLVFPHLSLVIFLPSSAYATNGVKQETKGNQSPAIYAPSGDVEVKIGLSEKKALSLIDQKMTEINNIFNVCIENAIGFQNTKLRELETELAEIYRKTNASSNDDAKKWARDTIEKAPQAVKAIEEQNKKIDQYNIELSKNIVAKSYKLFNYIFEFIDSRLSAIQELNPKVEYNINEYVLFRDENEDVTNNKVRYAIFPNGSKIKISINPGVLEKGLVRRCPSASFEEICERQCLSFRLKPQLSGGGLSIVYAPQYTLRKHVKITIKDIKYNIGADDYLADNFKNAFKERFEKLITYSLGK